MTSDSDIIKYLTKFTGPKTQEQRQLILEALDIMEQLGLNVGAVTQRKREKMAMVLAALAGLVEPGNWANASNKNKFTTKELVEFINREYNEEISRGSYDYIKRDGIDRTQLAGIIESSKPDANPSDSTRGYQISADYLAAIQSYGSNGWSAERVRIVSAKGTLQEKLKPKRKLGSQAADIPEAILELATGKHDSLIRTVLTVFLKNFGEGAIPLYFGSMKQRVLYRDDEMLKKLNFFEIGAQELPDVVAFSEKKNWVFLVEAVESGGEFDDERRLKFKQLLSDCSAELVFVSAFRNRRSFLKRVAHIAWETEVWLEDDPEHLIHFNGEKFLGPYEPQ